MRFHVEVGGRIREVAVERQDGVFAVTMDGETQRIDVARVDATTLSLIVLGEAASDAAASHEIGFVDGAGTADQWVYVDGVVVQAAPALRRRRRGDAAATGGPGVQRVLAPMPGKVIRVLVAAGDRVEPRQPVVVVEAMKMENELRAGKAGVVREVVVVPGASVEVGAVLVVIE